MFQIASKSLRLFIFGVIPLFLPASGSTEYIDRPLLEKGTYQFEVSGKITQNLHGMASFQPIAQEDGQGEFYNGLKLNFESNSDSDKHIIAFAVSQKSGENNFLTGIYKIKNVEQLFHSFEGVYGFVDLGRQNELPFFVNEGNIAILEKSYDGLVGSLEVKFKNADGEILNVKGFFNAN